MLEEAQEEKGSAMGSDNESHILFMILFRFPVSHCPGLFVAADVAAPVD